MDNTLESTRKMFEDRCDPDKSYIYSFLLDDICVAYLVIERIEDDAKIVGGWISSRHPILFSYLLDVTTNRLRTLKTNRLYLNGMVAGNYKESIWLQSPWFKVETLDSQYMLDILNLLNEMSTWKYRFGKMFKKSAVISN
jgi:hypothetical protein